MRFIESAQQDQRFFHPVVHIEQGIGVESANRGIDALIDGAGLCEVAFLHCLPESHLQVRDYASGSGEKTVTSQRERAEQPHAVSRQHADWFVESVQFANVALVQMGVVAPVLDRPDRGEFLAEGKQRFERIPESSAWILEQNDRQLRSLGNASDMSTCTFGPQLPTQPKDFGGKNEQSVSSVFRCHPGKTGRFCGIVRANANDDGNAIAHFIFRHLNAATLLVERKGVNLSRMAVYGDRRDVVDTSEVTKMTSEGSLVDFEV